MSIDPESAPPSSAVVQITLGRVYDVVTETRGDVRDLTNSMKGLVEHVGDHEARLRVIERDKTDSADTEKLEKRLGLVERKVWMGVGIGTVAAIGCSGLIAYVATMR